MSQPMPRGPVCGAGTTGGGGGGGPHPKEEPPPVSEVPRKDASPLMHVLPTEGDGVPTGGGCVCRPDEDVGRAATKRSLGKRADRSHPPHGNILTCLHSSMVKVRLLGWVEGPFSCFVVDTSLNLEVCQIRVTFTVVRGGPGDVPSPRICTHTHATL